MKKTSPMPDNQQSEAAPRETIEPLTGRPTCAEPIPPAFARVFQPAEGNTIPEFSKLPSPRERCRFTGASRTWLLEHGDLKHFKLVRIRKPGTVRGAVFVHVPSLLAFIRGEMEKQTSETKAENREGARDGNS
jgi:hypothetical protein